QRRERGRTPLVVRSLAGRAAVRCAGDRSVASGNRPDPGLVDPRCTFGCTPRRRASSLRAAPSADLLSGREPPLGMSMSTLVERITEYEAKIGMHHARSLAPAPLVKLEWYLQSYFEGKAVRSVETGCGASTIIFAQYAAQHTVYCYDDRSED